MEEQPQPASANRKERIKSWVIGAFVAEHIIAGLLISTAVLRVAKAYGDTGFSRLDKKAREYVPGDKEAAFKSLTTQAVSKAGGLLFWNEDRPFRADFFLTEKEFNDMVNQADLEYLERTYFEFKPGNEIRLWAGVEELEQPVMLAMTFDYRPEEGINLELVRMHLGPVPLPVRWFEFAEGTVETTINQYLKQLHGGGQVTVTRVWTEEGLVKTEVELTKPLEFLEEALKGASVSE